MDISAAGIRWTRAAVFTALCVTLSTGAHVLLSGTPVPLATLSLVSGAVFLTAFALAGRERGFGHIAALLVPLELFADTVFTNGQHACYGQAGGPVTGPLRSVGLDLLCAGGEVGTPLSGLAHGETPLAAAVHDGSPWLLLAVHIAIGLAAAGWLRRGEAAVARTLRAAGLAAFRPLLLAVARRRTSERLPAPARAPGAPRPAATDHALPLLAHSVLRRGPPRLPASV